MILKNFRFCLLVGDRQIGLSAMKWVGEMRRLLITRALRTDEPSLYELLSPGGVPSGVVLQLFGETDRPEKQWKVRFDYAINLGVLDLDAARMSYAEDAVVLAEAWMEEIPLTS